MKRRLSLLFWSVVLALVWAAAHDILSNESDVWMEYTVISIACLLALVVLVTKMHGIKPGGRP